MATTYHNQTTPAVYKVIHFTPTSEAHWCWAVTIPVITLSGPQLTITGQTVDVGQGISMWSGLPGAPSFKTRADAMHWTDLMQLPNVVAEI